MKAGNRKRRIAAALTLFFSIASAVCAIAFFHDSPLGKNAPAATAHPEQVSDGVPSSLQQALDKANGFAKKPIEVKDAADVAAILMKSGLSLKEIKFLVGQADEKLSNEEKQKIRDLLLSKLSKEEIADLRSIATQYGKKLYILDPDYPIELIGVYDSEERKRIQRELEEKKKAAAASATAVSAENKAEMAEPNADESKVDNPGADGPETASPPPIPEAPEIPEEPGDERQQAAGRIAQKYEIRLRLLQQSCEGSVSYWVERIYADVSAARQRGEALDLAQLQSAYMGKVAQAEQNCDKQFNQLMEAAEQEYLAERLDAGQVEAWRGQYASSKQKAQANALSELSSRLGKH